MTAPAPPRTDLKAELSRLGLTQREVATKMGIEHTYLSKLVNGRAPFTRLVGRSFAMATGIPLEQVLNDA